MSTRKTIFSLVQDLNQNPCGKFPAAPEKKAATTFVPKKKWTTALDNHHIIDFGKAIAGPLDRESIDWKNNVISIERAGEGSEGLFFVALKKPENAVLILKRSSGMAAEVLSACLAMRLGIPTPSLRIVSMNTAEGNEILDLLKNPEIDPSARGWTVLSQQSFVLLMEFVPGKSLRNIDRENCIRLFGRELEEPSEQGKRSMQNLGRIMVLDMLINNADRIPLIWANEGNFGNIMMAAQMTSIDAKIVPIDPEKNLDIYAPYLTKVRSILEKMDSLKEDQELRDIEMIRERIQIQMDYDPGFKGGLEMQKGFLELVNHIRTSKINFKKEIDEWCEMIKSEFEGLEVNPQSGDFVQKIVDLIKEPHTVAIPSVTPKEKRQIDIKAFQTCNPSEQVPKEEIQTLPSNSQEFSWKRINTTGAKPRPRRYGKSVAYKGKMYVFGGQVPSKSAENDLWFLDFDELKWSSLNLDQKERPPARFGHSAVAHEDSMFVFGGTSDGKTSAMNDLWQFHFPSQKWTKIEVSEAVPPPRFHHAVAVVDSCMYVFGGSIDVKNHLDDLWTFCFKTKKWTQQPKGAESPSPRSGAISWAYNDKFWIYGGADGPDKTICDLWNFSGGKWNEIEETGGSLPITGRPISNTVFDGNHTIFIFGGYNGKTPTGNLLGFDLRTHIWKVYRLWMEMDLTNISASTKSSKGMQPIPRYGHSMTIENGLITVFGGSGSMYLDDTFQIDLNDDDDEE